MGTDAEDLGFYEYAVIQAGFAALEEAREARLAAVALLRRLRDEAKRVTGSATGRPSE